MIDRTGRITDENITQLKDDEVFVYGSNESGINGAGAAKLAEDKGWARDGQGYGFWGKSFAVPTKSWDLERLPLKAIECYIARFLGYAIIHPEKKFLITQIGCGLAGFTPEEIAPYFAGFEEMQNVCLPQSFWNVLDKVFEEELYKHMSIKDDGSKNEVRNFPG